MAKKYTLGGAHQANGDTVHHVYAVNTSDARGTVRHNPRTGDYHGVKSRKGKLLSRYYATESGAANWVLK